MGGGGENGVVMLGTHAVDLRPTESPHLLDGSDGGGVGGGGGGENHPAVAVEFGKGGLDPAVFSPGDGVSGD